MSEKRIGNYLLPPGIEIFERGWLSANNVLLFDEQDVSLVDTGYCAHQQMTLDLVSNSLKQHGLKTLNKVVNTHLHSDHCGGNAVLSDAFDCEIWIPQAEAIAVESWDEHLLSFEQLGQECPRFIYQSLLIPGNEIILGPYHWQILAAPGHDNHSIMLYQEQHQILISADALWEEGFGVIFPELWGEGGFEEVAQTLELIEGLSVALVIPGHGKPFTDVRQSIETAKSRLDYLSSDADRNARHGAKVLLKYKLLEWRSRKMIDANQWILSTPVLENIRKQLNMNAEDFQVWLVGALVKSKAAMIEKDHLVNLD
ncbi:MAG: MBL fold metallo-hydrolase [Polynucleobacter sp. 24-46-87]|uniref:MBL fold metallo-hydrolase n=1 Tax=unclassified Polynucleobacter TaxID=2640945 RepID=UPI000BCB3B42|nr:MULTISPECIES: MBL fold metallo-hydrolase [unclassified Polynucleobacter]OYY21324.1 MAG: MBL fold metallo-hydrolase [Polynucleobacter sp. 35-46-11]OZA16223.1 MAG: MBL fold metallo-hydrolase [Polynucleobacter sp. 24-46-87]OZA77175.1 MAG: MBL fold metallo-hydrolase [Polynucleobacter sp. 39-46-10]